MPGRIGPTFWIVAHVGIGIHATGVGLRGVGPHKAAAHRVIVAETVIKQPGLAIEALPREVVGGGHTPLAVAYRTVGREELHRLRAAGTSERNRAAAQHVGEQVGERAPRFERHALAIDVVVFGGGRGAPSQYRLAVAIEGDGVGDTAGAHPLQHAVALVVVEEAIAGRGAAGRRPACQAPFIVIGHQRAGRAAATGVPTPRVAVAAGHVAPGVIACIRVRNAAQIRRRVHMIVVAIAEAACRTADHAIQAVIAERLLVGGERGAAGRGATVIASAGRAAVACPHQSTHGIVTEGLVVGLRASARGGHGGRQLQHIAHVVVGAPLAPDGAATHAGAGRLRALDAVIADAQGEHRRGRAALGSAAPDGQAGQLPAAGVAGLPHQEIDRIRRAGGAEVGGLETAIGVVLRGEGLPIGIDQAGDPTAIVVAHLHGLGGRGPIRCHRERALVLLSALVVAVTAPATTCTAAEQFGGGAPDRVGGIGVGRGDTTCREGDAGIARVAIAVVEELRIGTVTTGIDCRLRRAPAQRAVERVVAGIDALVARVDLAELIAIGVVAVLPDEVTAVAAAGWQGGVATGAKIGIVEAGAPLEGVIGGVVAGFERATAVVGPHHAGIAQGVVGGADRPYHAVGAAGPAVLLRVARAAQRIGEADGLVVVGIQGNRALKGRAAIGTDAWHARGDGIADARLQHDGAGVAVGDAAQRAAQRVVAGDGARFALVRGDIARRGGDAVGQALGRLVPHVVVNAVADDGRAAGRTGRLRLDQVPPAIVPLLHGGGGPTHGEARGGIQFQAGRGAAVATGVGIGIAHRRTAGAVSWSHDGSQSPQDIVLV